MNSSEYYVVTSRDTARRVTGKLLQSFVHYGRYATKAMACAALSVEPWHDDYDPSVILRVTEVPTGPRSMRFLLTR